MAGGMQNDPPPINSLFVWGLVQALHFFDGFLAPPDHSFIIFDGAPRYAKVRRYLLFGRFLFPPVGFELSQRLHKDNNSAVPGGYHFSPGPVAPLPCDQLGKQLPLIFTKRAVRAQIFCECLSFYGRVFAFGRYKGARCSRYQICKAHFPHGSVLPHHRLPSCTILMRNPEGKGLTRGGPTATYPL